MGELSTQTTVPINVGHRSSDSTVLNEVDSTDRC